MTSLSTLLTVKYQSSLQLVTAGWGYSLDIHQRAACQQLDNWTSWNNDKVNMKPPVGNGQVKESGKKRSHRE